MKNSETQKTVERGVFQFLLDFYLNLLKQLVIYSVNVCVYMLNKVIMSNDVLFSINHLTNKKSHEESSQKVNNNNWVRKWTFVTFGGSQVRVWRFLLTKPALNWHNYLLISLYLCMGHHVLPHMYSHEENINKVTPFVSACSLDFLISLTLNWI